MILAASLVLLQASRGGGLGGAFALTYHDIIPSRGPGSVWFDATVREFTDQLDWLARKGARFVSVEQVERAFSGAALPPRAVLLTFADGYRGFYRYALPLLRKRRIPVVMFVHTAYVGSPVGRPKMTWADLSAAAATGLVTVASQTVTHPVLTEIGDAALARELTESKRTIAQRFGSCRYFAYPDGKFDDRVSAAARTAGYALAFTERLTTLGRAPDRWRVPRWVHTKYREAWRAANARTFAPR